MSMLDILNNEAKYQKEFPYQIHFFMENGGWWRAYEFSSFLCHAIQKNIDKENYLKVTKKHLKGYGEYVFVGLKTQSFNKYFPNIELNLDKIENDKHIVLNVSDILKDIPLEKLKTDYIEWKNEIKLSTKTNETANINNNNSKHEIVINDNTIFGVLQQVLGYPLDDKSPNENTLFIKKLKEELIQIIIKYNA